MVVGVGGGRQRRRGDHALDLGAVVPAELSFTMIVKRPDDPLRVRVAEDRPAGGVAVRRARVALDALADRDVAEVGREARPEIVTV